MYRSPVGSSRLNYDPDDRVNNFGFRVVRPSPLARASDILISVTLTTGGQGSTFFRVMLTLCEGERFFSTIVFFSMVSNDWPGIMLLAGHLLVNLLLCSPCISGRSMNR